MRWLALLVLGACTSQYGAIFVIDGDQSFDQLELYFAKASGVDQFATPVFGTQTGTVFHRQFDASDIVLLDGAQKHYRYFVPANEKNAELGDYVAVVARQQISDGKVLPVAIGERFAFAIPSDAIHEYDVPLVGFPQLVDLWADPGCLAWKHSRTSTADETVAVVHADDHDCDNLEVANDCNDLCTQGGTAACDLNEGCSDAATCATGCFRNNVCEPTMCLPTLACEPLCSGALTVAEKITCAITMEAQHIDIAIDYVQGRLCAPQVRFELGVPCTMPVIEAVMPADAFDQFSITAEVSTGECVLSILAPIGAVAPEYHLLISVASPVLGPRNTVIVGVHPKPNGTATVCPMPGYNLSMNGQVYDCH